MSSNSTSSVSKRKDESSSQSRLTSYFKPNPEASGLRKNQEKNDYSFNPKQIEVKKRITQESPTKVTQHTRISPVKRSDEVTANNSVAAVKKRKRVIRDSPIKEESLVKKNEVIAIDLDSSDRDSSLEEELGLSPLKKLMSPRVAKRPDKLQSFLTVSTNLPPDVSTKKAGLAMRSPNKSSSVRDNISSQIAFEEKKNLNRGKRSAVPDDNVDIIFSPVKKPKRSNSQEDSAKGVKDKVRRKPSIVLLGNSTSNSVSSHSQTKDENKSKVSDIFAEKLDFEGKIDAAKKTKTTATRNIPEASILTENNVSSSRQRKSKRPPASPDFTKKQKKIKEKVTETPEKSIPEKRSTSKESAVAAVNVDEAIIKTKSQAAKEAETSEKASRRIVRRSQHTTEENGVSISSKITVGLDEIQAGAVVAYRETYKDMETLLDLNLDTTICSDFQKALQISIRNLPSDSHVNFKFFINRKPVNYIDALRSLHVDCYQYPLAVDLHIVIHQFLMNVTEHSVLHRALELIYATLGLHPSGDVVMRKYYWSVISRRFDDTDPCSRWEILRELLEEVMSADGDDAKKMYIDPNKPTTQMERTRAVLAVFIQVLREDLRCWISLTSEPFAQLQRDRNDLPLVARLLWPQTTIPHVNVVCRELMDFHLAALKSSNPTNLLYTEPLVKMMTIVTQMSDLQLPLQIRKPGVHMMNLAREIVLRSDDLTNSSFCSSFGSSELELLLPLVIMNRLKPQIPIPEGENLNLTWMLNSYLEIGEVKKREDVVARFRSQPAVERNAFLTALSAYFKLFGSFRTWFHMRTRYRYPDRPTPVQQSSPEPPPVNMFSRTFTLSHLMEDLRQAKYLLEVDKGLHKKASLYSLLSGK